MLIITPAYLQSEKQLFDANQVSHVLFHSFKFLNLFSLFLTNDKAYLHSFSYLCSIMRVQLFIYQSDFLLFLLPLSFQDFFLYIFPKKILIIFLNRFQKRLKFIRLQNQSL